MTPRQIELVQDSLGFLAGNGLTGELSRRFYEQLFEDDPAIAAKFPSDLSSLRPKFVAMLQSIVDALDHIHDLVLIAKDLGTSHVGFGATASDYDAVGSALIDALADVLGDRFTPEVRSAWLLGYNLIAEAMMAGGTALEARGRP